ncbi:MAG: M23 family metallopeptidase [Brevinematia bacterium]
MAKEIIKKPAFKSKAEMYKKSKWAKFKEKCEEVSTNFKREIQKITYRIHQKGSQKLTLMIVPHSEKRIINIQISNYIMFFFSLILIVIVISSVIAISNNQQTQRQLIFLKTQSEYNKALIAEYKKAIDSFSRRFTAFKVDIGKVIKREEETKSEIKDLRVGEEATAKDLPRELNELEKLKNELKTLENDIYRVGIFKNSYERLLKEIPSQYPLTMKAYISSFFGYRRDPVYPWTREFHQGLDMVVVPGTPVLAAANGVVKFAGWMGGYGWMVEIEHKYGFSTRYGHLMGFNSGVFPGAVISRGQTIGFVGSTGKSTGYHLHFEVRVGGQPIDPLPFTQMLQ